ncbi:MAG: NHL repeat-containing protein [Thaumarchaeota archaeon]|nr:NHL repeat-containing protein [Nitrososphaerota archaeon]MDE1877537.1 NHL repeat-containing protein [Nitrososphaerota archaeon]
MTNQNSSFVVGQPSFTTMINTPINSSSLNGPIGLAFDSAGNFWVADSGNNRILNYSSSSFGFNHPNATTVLGQSSFTAGGFGTTATTLRAASALAFDSSGNLWVADEDNSRILEYTHPFTTGQAASLVLGQSSFTTGSTGTSTTTLNTPDALAFDSHGNLWVSDQGNHRILEYSPPFTTGQAASLVLGHSTFTQSSSGINATALNNPFSLVFDSSGNLWVTDQNNNRILRYSTPFTNNMAASLVLGQSSFTTNTVGTSNNTLNNPSNIVFDSSGNLWVADGSNNRVLEYKSSFSNGMAASLVFGHANFTSNGINNGFANPSASSLNDVNGLLFDKSGNLWAADSANNRIIRFVQTGQNQALVDNSIATVTVNPTTPQLMIANSNTNLSTIKIPSTVTNTTINYSNILVKKSDGNSVTLNNALTVKANSTNGNVQILLPKNIVINGSSSWKGTINTATISSVSLPQGTLPAAKIEVGFGSAKLTLSKAVELVFSGNAGKRIGFTHGGPFTEITQVCSTDDATGIPSGSTDCKIDVGSDLHVWTLHFTTFVVFTVQSAVGGSTPGFAPSFTTGFAQNEYPLTINANNYKLPNYTNTGIFSTIQVGEPFVIKVLLYGDNGLQSVKHVSLVTNMRGNYASIAGADTAIFWDATQPLQIVDPHHFFGPVTANTTVVDNKILLTFHGTFAKPMPVSNIGIRTWGYDLYSRDVYVINAWQATSSPPIQQLYTTPPSQKQLPVNDSTVGATLNLQSTNPQLSSTSNKLDLMESIKEWGGYSNKSISDSEMLHMFGLSGDHVPQWVMKNIKWIIDGTINIQDFGDALHYLSDNKIIK